jgi:hypothetical protein
MNLYGNFFGIDGGPSIESLMNGRSVLYGFQDRMVDQGDAPIIREVLDAWRSGSAHYEATLEKYGGSFATLMPSSAPTRVKALREVYPALENLKNLVFASECGLRIPVDPVRAALPCANRIQCDRFRNLLVEAAGAIRPGEEVLRIVASHQLYGVGFGAGAVTEGRLTLRIDPTPIDPAKAYHQSQQ